MDAKTAVQKQRRQRGQKKANPCLLLPSFAVFINPGCNWCIRTNRNNQMLFNKHLPNPGRYPFVVVIVFGRNYIIIGKKFERVVASADFWEKLNKKKCNY